MIPVGLLDSGRTPIYTYLSNVNNAQIASGSNSITTTSRSIGTASSDRIVIVTTSFSSGAFDQSAKVTGVTCNGTAMTPIVTPYGSTTDSNIWYLLVPTGTTANFVTTLTSVSSDPRAGFIGFSTIKGYESGTPIVTNGNSTYNKDLSISEGDIIVSASSTKNSTGAYIHNVSAMEITVRYNSAREVATESRWDTAFLAGQVITTSGTYRILPSAMTYGTEDWAMYAVWR